MTAQRMKDIQDSIEGLKEQRTKAQAKMEQIEEDWKSSYEVNNIDEAQAKARSLQTELDGYEGQLEKLSTQIEGITDWDEVGE